jgi:hypothetical protein
MRIYKLEHIFIEVTVGGFHPVFFDAYLYKPQLLEEFNAFVVIGKDIAPELVKLKCPEAIICETFQCH